MPTVSASVRVSGSAERAFREVTDAAGQGRWMLATTVYPVAGDQQSPHVGARLAAFTGLAGIGVLDTMLVTDYEPPHRWVVAHQGHVVRGSGIFEVTPSAGAVIVTWTEDLQLPFGLLGRIAWPLVRPLMKAGLGISMRRLGRLVERP